MDPLVLDARYVEHVPCHSCPHVRPSGGILNVWRDSPSSFLGQLFWTLTVDYNLQELSQVLLLDDCMDSGS